MDLEIIFHKQQTVLAQVTKFPKYFIVYFGNTLQTLRPHKNSHHLWRAKPTRRSEHPAFSLCSVQFHKIILSSCRRKIDHATARSLHCNKPQVSRRDKVCLYDDEQHQIKIWATDAAANLVSWRRIVACHLISRLRCSLTMMDFFRTRGGADVPALSHYWRKTVARVVRGSISSAAKLAEHVAALSRENFAGEQTLWLFRD